MENAHKVGSDMIDNFLRALIEIGSMVPNVNDCALYTNLKSSFENFCFSSESNQYQLENLSKENNHATEVTENTEITENAGDQIT